ncbi:MAG TPA: hypothetical protein VHC69_19125 [Polyangiaceae bacterium]|nr:hypothetical protein [Polyangiaceae bacterium]
MPARRSHRPRARATAALFAAAVVCAAGCVRNVEHSTADVREDIAVWDFPIALPPNTLHLWPLAPGTPLRSKHHLETKTDPGKLTAVVAGDDPYFVWQLETPISTYGVHVVAESATGGALQLFWSTPKCPVFSEPCSTTFQLEPGRHALDFPLDPRDPLRELRLDLPEGRGVEFDFYELFVLRTAELGFDLVANASVSAMTEASTGLYVDAISRDPWLIALTPGLDTSRITAAELVLRAPSGSVPQLYWGTKSSGFTETTSSVFQSFDGGEVTHRAKLHGRVDWTGKVDMLRLDPGDGPGRYIVERLALVHDPSD